MKIEYTNMPNGSNKLSFTLRYIFNIIRSWFIFNFIYPWVKYKGFVRVMPNVEFVKNNITIGHKVQFGKGSLIAFDVDFGNNILIAANVSFVGRKDHDYTVPGVMMWDSPRGKASKTIVEDDVWIGHGCIIIGGVTIGKGSIIAAGSVVTKNIPPCEIWGGIPAKKIRNRFCSDLDTENHIKQITLNTKNTNKL